MSTPVCPSADVTGSTTRALVRGLKILEYLAASRDPVRPSKLAATLQMSPSTTSRLLMVLQQRGYVARSDKDGTYTATRHLLDMPTMARPLQRLLGHARPVMRGLADRIAQSCNLACNLAAPSSPDLHVVAHQESPGPFGMHVPKGFRYDIPASAPGLVFAAFMRHSDPTRWPSGLSPAGDDLPWVALKDAVRKATEAGFVQSPNPHFPDIIELSCPVFDRGDFVAVLTVPYIKSTGSPDVTWCLAHLQQAAEHLNESLRCDAKVT